MNVTGIPTAPISAGQTVCITVTGAPGVVTTGTTGSITVQSTTQTSTRPNEWTVCFVVAQGLGTVQLRSGDKTRALSFRGR